MNNKIDKTHVGKRLLITDRYTECRRIEVEVLEVSPSEVNVKLKGQHATYWEDTDESRIIEELPLANTQDLPRRT